MIQYHREISSTDSTPITFIIFNDQSEWQKTGLIGIQTRFKKSGIINGRNLFTLQIIDQLLNCKERCERIQSVYYMDG
jgi:hypothetical protein